VLDDAIAGVEQAVPGRQPRDATRKLRTNLEGLISLPPFPVAPFYRLAHAGQRPKLLKCGDDQET
jgi:hypothetical protein